MIETIGLEDVEFIIKKIKKKLRNIAEVYVFGSIVENCAIPFESDLDLLVVSKKEIDVFSILEEEIREILNLGLSPHIIVVEEIPSHLKKERMVKIV